MFFLITNITIGKYYNHFLTQFIVGCVFYTITFFIIKDLISNATFEKYKYYFLAVVGIDASYLVYKYNTTPKSLHMLKKNIEAPIVKQPIQSQNSSPIESKIEKITNDPKCEPPSKSSTSNNYSDLSIDLSSELNDYRVTHDISSEESTASLFSMTDEDEDKQKNL